MTAVLHWIRYGAAEIVGHPRPDGTAYTHPPSQPCGFCEAARVSGEGEAS